jgi:hypothetical protein
MKGNINMSKVKSKSMCGACYSCVYRGTIPGDAHSKCTNKNANVTGVEHGIRSGWFMWPFNFDPVWLISCDGYKEKIV